MPPNAEEKFVNNALDIFHKVQQDIEPNEFCNLTKELYNSIEQLSISKLFSLEDLRWAIRDDMDFHWSTTIRNVSDEHFIKRFKFTILTTKNYDFNIPIYCLYDFPSGTSLAKTTVKTFSDLPADVQSYFVNMWQFRFGIDNEYHHSKEEYVNLKKKSVFLHLVVKVNGRNKAIDIARDMAEDALHIIRFVYEVNFDLIDIRYAVKETGEAGGLKDITGLPFCGGANYHEMYASSLNIISSIFSKPNPNDIEKRARKAIQIFGTQETITNKNVRFLLLMSCLESLLLAESDRDYILWRLAEKTAFVLGRNMRQVNDYIRDAYGRRSAFIHASSRGSDPITADDIDEAKKIVADVIWILIVEFVGKRGYSQIVKNGDPKKNIQSINEYIDEMKFGSKN